MAKTKQEKLDLKAEKQYYKTHKKKQKLTVGDVIFNILNSAFFGIFTISCIFPFYYLFINTISDNALVRIGAINFIPKGIHFQNYLSLRMQAKYWMPFWFPHPEQSWVRHSWF